MSKIERQKREKILQVSPATKELKDVLEKKIEDLSRQLAEEKQCSRKEKLQVARLQREIARNKGTRDSNSGKDTTMKDLERERMLRVNAEQRLREMTLESDSCRSRLQNLQEEFKRMEELVRNMLQYKTKIDQLKHEKSSLSITYENNVQKYRSHISNLEKENILLTNEVKRFESQICGKLDDRGDKSKLLLERLKILEAENSSLVLENEQQRQQYEKCLDEIANQVVQALLAQKTLREECIKLQTRVQDLELQNHQLSLVFHQKVKYSSDTVLQALPSTEVTSNNPINTTSSYPPLYSSATSLPTEAQLSTSVSFTKTMQYLSPMSQYILQSAMAQRCIDHSTESLHSICSDYTYSESVGKSQMENSSPWIPDLANHDTPSNSIQSMDMSDLNSGLCCRTKIETEFPASNTSPKMKHVSVIERAKTRRSASVTSLQGPVRPKAAHTRSTSSLNKAVLSQSVTSTSERGSTTSLDKREISVQTVKSNMPQRKVQTHVAQVHASHSNNAGKNVSKNIRHQPSNVKTGIPLKLNKNTKTTSSQNSLSKIPLKNSRNEKDQKSSVGRKNSLGNLSNTSSYSSASKSQTSEKNQSANPNRKPVIGDNNSKDRMMAVRQNLGSPPRVPLLPNAQYFYDYSDEDSDINRPMSSSIINTGSTVSLNEILDNDDDTDTLLDEDFTADHFAFFDTPPFMKNEKEKLRMDNQLGKNKGRTPSDVSLHGKPDIIRDTENSELKNQGKSPLAPRRRLSSLQHNQIRRKHIQRPNSLVLPSKEHHSLRHGYSSSSLDSSDSEENWSPQFARQNLLKIQQENSSSCASAAKTGQSESKKLNALTKTNLKQEQMSCSIHDNRLSALESVNKVISSKDMNIDSIESCQTNSLGRKKGPPPPIPKKPVSGKRSPGIRMGLQSPGFRQNKKETASPVNILKDQNVSNKFSDLKQDSFSRSTGCDTKISGEVSGMTKQPSSKYVSSDSSFESVKAEKVERSASRDDGYSTMSSDIQPEAMEKYSDTSLNRNDCPKKKEVFTKEQEGGNKKDSTSSDQDSAMDSSTQSTELKHSSHSLSSQNSTSSEDKSTTIYGSLGRVKAMKSLFEAEAHKGTEKLPVKFPLRKSPSYDSKFGVKDSDKSSDISQNRRSLSADFKICPTEIQSPVKEEVKLGPEPVKCVEQNTVPPFKADSIKIEHEEINTNYFVQDKSAIFNSLNISEDNFLSDIPEEKDDWETSAHSSIRHLENVSSKFPQIPLFRSQLPFNLATLDSSIKKCLPSVYEFYRTFSDSDISQSSKKFRNIVDLDLRKFSIDKPLERSVSMSELYKKRKVSDISFNLPPNLRRSFRQPLMDEEMVIGRAQDIVKSHILQQLSQFVESESDDEDLDQFSFSSVLKRSKYNHQLEPHHKDNCDQLWNDKRTSLNLAIKRIYAGNIPQDKHSSYFEGFHGNLTSQDTSDGANCATHSLDVEEDKNLDKGRQSSHESSPMPEGQTKFRSDYYSLCLVGSNRSLCSGSNEGESDMAELTASQTNPNSAKHSYEFDMISRQIESLSKTVNDLHKSLSSLNSCDSDNESNEDHSQMFTSPSENFRDTHGYHWVEDDEFYLTPSGGEIILGSSPFSNTGAGCEFVNEYADDTSCNDEFEYFGNFSPDQPPFDVKKLYSDVKEGENVVLKSESKPVTESGKKDVSAIVKQKLSKMKEENMFEVKSVSRPTVSRTVDDNMVLDPEIRAAMLDSMVHLSGASMDSLDDNIGVDQVMCSRLLGRGDKDGVVKHASTPRPALDVSNLFFRYGDNEKEAVAAFDFLDDISTSSATSQTEISSMCQTEMDQSDQSVVDNVEQMTNQTTDEAKTSVVESQGLDNSNITEPMDQNLNKNSANCKKLSSSDNKVNKGSNRTKNKERSKIPKAIKQDTNMTKSTRKSCDETSGMKSTRKSSTGSNSGNRSSSNS